MHNVFDTCLGIKSLVRDLQALDKDFISLGKDYKDFESSWDDKTWSLVHLYTKDSRIKSLSKLRQNFQNALENRYCRRNYQQSINVLEGILDLAIPKHGEEWVLNSMPNSYRITRDGAIDDLISAGITIRNPERLKDLCKKAAQKSKANKRDNAPRNGQ
jgi:hypothetical protein